MSRAEYIKKYREKNRERLRWVANAYYIKNREKLNLKSKKWMSNKLIELRKEVFSILGDRCLWCEEDDFRCLQIDHVNGGGSKERQKINGATTYYKHVLSKIKGDSKEYQTLCANCNWRKKYDNKEIITSIV